MSDALEARYRARSLWLDRIAEPLTPRPALAGDRDCDVAIVGAGFTGLWAAYFLALLQPDLRIVVVEREIAGFGPSGRNGGWASAGLAGSARRYERLRGHDAVRRGERAMADAVSEIGNVVRDEAIDCGWRHTGTLMVATSAPQVTRLHEGVARRRSFGMGEDDSGLPLHRGIFVPFAKTAAGPSLLKPMLDLALVGTVRRVVRKEGLKVIFAHNYEALMVALAARACSAREC